MAEQNKPAAQTTARLPEVWLRGALPEVPSLLQPVAHALLQAKEELAETLVGFPERLLWEKPAGVASVGFHLLHMAGVLDRLFTYAEGNGLSPEQLAYLAAESQTPPEATVLSLTEALNTRIDISIERLGSMANADLTEARFVGRKRLPSTIQGLIFHSAEHTMRHLGQLLVTARILKAGTE